MSIYLLGKVSRKVVLRIYLNNAGMTSAADSVLGAKDEL